MQLGQGKPTCCNVDCLEFVDECFFQSHAVHEVRMDKKKEAKKCTCDGTSKQVNSDQDFYGLAM